MIRLLHVPGRTLLCHVGRSIASPVPRRREERRRDRERRPAPINLSATSVTLVDAFGNVSTRGEAVFNRVRMALHRLAAGADSTKSTSSSSPSVALTTLNESLDKELKETLEAYRVPLVDVLRAFPKWFALNDAGATVRLTTEAASLPEPMKVFPLGSASVDVSATEDRSRMSPHQRPKGVSGSTPVIRWRRVDPPLSREEVEASRLETLVAETLVPFMHNAPPPSHPLPRGHVTEMVTTFSEPSSRAAEARWDNPDDPLPEVPQLAPFDRVYSMKGFYSPSEVLHIFCCLVPTYSVEVGALVRCMPPSLRMSFMSDCPVQKDGRLVNIARPFLRYPMVFDVDRKPGSKTLVKLNATFPFVSEHPHFGLADRRMRKFSKEFSTRRGVVSREKVRLERFEATPASSRGKHSVSTSDGEEQTRAATVPRHLRMTGLSLDTRIFMILIEHLPQQNPSNSTVCPPTGGEVQVPSGSPFVSLVQWINGFPKEHLETLNEAPQERVLSIISKYRRIFQLSSIAEDDTNLFRASAHLLKVTPELRESGVEKQAISEEASSATVDLDSNDPKLNCDADDAPALSPPMDSPETDRRVEAFRSAVAEDMIGGVESLLDMNASDEVFDRGADADDVGEGEQMDDAREPGEEEQEENLHASNNSHAHPSGIEDSECMLSSPIDTLAVRRLPRHIAPGSLSDLDGSTTPDPALLDAVFSAVPPPPSIAATIYRPPPPSSISSVPSSSASPLVWRWVPIERIYRSLSAEQRHALRRYKGLPNFLRLHGALFEVSADLRYVIAHESSDKDCVVPPLIPTQKLFSDAERTVLPDGWDETKPCSPERKKLMDAVLRAGTEHNATFRRILGDAQIPRTRLQLKLLDPNNPLLELPVLLDEIAEFLPMDPVPYKSVFTHLPPVLAAAVPTRRAAVLRHALQHPDLLLFNRRGLLMITRRTPEAVSAVKADTFAALITEQDIRKFSAFDSAEAPIVSENSTSAGAEVWSLTRALKFIESVISPNGTSIEALSRKLPKAAMNAIAREVGETDLNVVIAAFPDRFQLRSVETEPNDAIKYAKKKQLVFRVGVTD